MSQSMFHELCDKCHKSLFMVHPDDRYNCHCTKQQDDSPIFVFDDEDDDVENTPTKLCDVQTGTTFFYNGQKYTKVNDLGWGMGICNIKDATGTPGHLHPNTHVSLIH